MTRPPSPTIAILVLLVCTWSVTYASPSPSQPQLQQRSQSQPETNSRIPLLQQTNNNKRQEEEQEEEPNPLPLRITYEFQAYTSPNCNPSSKAIHIKGNTPQTCANTTITTNQTSGNENENEKNTQMQSYIFTTTLDPDTNETFSVRLYDREGCEYLSVIHDGMDGECVGVGFRSFNFFTFTR